MRDGALLRLAGDLLLSGQLPTRVPPMLADLCAADLSVANLEGPLLAAGRASLSPNSAGAPSIVARQMSAAGLAVATVANNHVLDAGVAGLVETLSALDDAGLLHTGAGSDLASAARPVVWTRGELRVGILAGLLVLPQHGLAGFSGAKNAGPDRPGVFTIRGVLGTGGRVDVDGPDAEVFERAIASARAGCDHLVVSIHYHWPGGERWTPADEVVNLFKRAIDAGATLVVGHGPHEVRAIEVYRGCFIAYGLGSLVFQLPAEVDRDVRDHFSGDERFGRAMYVEAVLHEGRSIEALRCQLVVLSREGLPERPAPDLEQRLMEELAASCRARGAHARVDGGKLYVSAGAGAGVT